MLLDLVTYSQEVSVSDDTGIALADVSIHHHHKGASRKMRAAFPVVEAAVLAAAAAAAVAVAVAAATEPSEVVAWTVGAVAVAVALVSAAESKLATVGLSFVSSSNLVSATVAAEPAVVENLPA